MGAKLKAVGLLIFMYGLGIASGLAWDLHRDHHQLPPRAIFGERRIAHLKKELQLDPWQEQNLREIVQDARERANDIHDAVDYDIARIRADSTEELELLLRPDQQARFNLLREQMRIKRMKREAQSGAVAPPVATPQGSAVATLEPSSQKVKTSQADLHQARKAYLATVRSTGENTPQSQAAKARLDTARSTWHGKLTDRKHVRHQAQREIRNPQKPESPAP